MQIGTSWRRGAEVPKNVPASLRETIFKVDSSPLYAGDYWKLTWLEGRPVCSLSETVSVVLDPEMNVVVLDHSAEEEEDDEWLA